ncbi:MAG: hypothetical protein WAZ14_00620 [Patescibacteria group bacterium]
MDNIFSLQFWFDLTPVRLSTTFEIGFFIIFALAIIAGLSFRIMRKSRKDKFERRALERMTGMSVFTGIAGLFWLFLATEEISIFGARFWFLIIMLILAVSIGRLVYFQRTQVPALRLQEQSKSEANKYLPRRR